MKKLLILILLHSVVLGCNQKNSEKKVSEFESNTNLKTQVKSKPIKADTNVIYWQTNFDTIQNIQEIFIGNAKHKLLLKTYSLNDSSIVSINGSTKGIYHDYVSEIILSNLNDTILNQKITKQVFKDSLHSEFYKLSVLTGIKYNGTRSNKLYFKGELNVPDTDWVIENEFEIFYQTEKENQINSWNYRDVGL